MREGRVRREGETVGVKKLLGPHAGTRELDQSGPWVPGREALLIPEDLLWGFCVRDLNSGWRCGWCCGLIYLRPLLTQPR